MEIGPRPSWLNTQFSEKSNSTCSGKRNHSRMSKKEIISFDISVNQKNQYNVGNVL